MRRLSPNGIDHHRTMNGDAAQTPAQSDMDADATAEMDADVDTYIVGRNPDDDQEPGGAASGPATSAAADDNDASMVPATAPASTSMSTCSSYEIKPMASALHFASVNCLSATRDFRWFFTGSDDGFIRKFDFYATIDGETMLTNTQRHGLVDSIQKAGVLISAWENESKPSDVKPIEVNATQADMFDNRISPVYSIDVHSEGVWCLSGLENGRINLWTVRHDEGTCAHVFDAHKSPVSVLKISPNERSFVSGSWDRTVKLWNLDTGQMMREFKGAVSQITSASFQPTSATATTTTSALKTSSYLQPGGDAIPMLVTSFDGKIFLFDYREPNGLVKRFPGTFGSAPPWALSACCNIDGTKIYCGRRNCTVDEIDIRMGTLVRSIKLPLNSGPVSLVHCMPNGRNLLCASYDNLRLWDLNQDPEPQPQNATMQSSSNDTKSEEPSQKDHRVRQNSLDESLPAGSEKSVTTGDRYGKEDIDDYDDDDDVRPTTQRISQRFGSSMNTVDIGLDTPDRRFIAAFEENTFVDQDPFLMATQSPVVPERTGKKSTKRHNRHAAAHRHDAGGASMVPFTIIPGHHGGGVSSLVMNETGEYIVAASGTRGWDGVSTNTCFVYINTPIP